jgi:hypothetical protein
MESKNNSADWIYPIYKRRKQFFIDEIEEMKKDKWIESEKANMDLGENIYQAWIDKWAIQFRETWENKFGKTD